MRVLVDMIHFLNVHEVLGKTVGFGVGCSWLVVELEFEYVGVEFDE